MNTKTLARVACRLARLLAILLCLLWGAFFVEHLQEWFLDEGELPPAKVWVGQALHLVMILGLGMIVFWRVLGAVVTVVATASFFSWIGVNRFPYVALLNLLPIVFVIAGTVLRGRHAAGPGVPSNDDPAAPSGSSGATKG